MQALEEYNEEFEEIESGCLTEEEVFAIQEDYRRKKLIESLIGPVVSTIFHVVLIILFAILFTDQVKKPVAEIVVVMEEVQEVEIEPPVEEPEPEEIQKDDTTNPVLTTVAVENVVTNDQALEDTNDDAPSTDDNMADQAVSDVIISPSAFASSSVMGGRSASGRASSVSQFGGSKAGQDKLLKALWWLKKVQNPDGSWGKAENPAHTGLALLTFLAHGEIPSSKNFGSTVKKAMKWLQSDPVGKKHGKHGRAYGHAIKSYALAEAYAMTGISSIEDSMNKNIRRVIDGMQEGGSYDYHYKKTNRQDLSLAGWNYQALKAASVAGCEEPGLQEAIYKAIDWLKEHTRGKNKFPYDTNNNKTQTKEPRPSMRAVGVLCLQLFGEGQCEEIKDDLEVIATKDLANYKWETTQKQSLYGWYYATQTMFQAGGDKWRKWNRNFQKVLGDSQHKEGYWRNDNINMKVDGGDLTLKIYSTCLAALQLTVYYRYLPSSKGAVGVKAEKKDAKMEEEALDLVE